MARAVSTQRKVLVTGSAWLAGFIVFFPILWMVITSFKTEQDATAMPPLFVFFHWTLENYHAILDESNYGLALWNSIFLSVGSTLLGLIFAVPAAWAMAFAPGPKTKDLLLWMLSTKMMPAVGALMPLFLLFNYFGWLDHRWAVMVVMFLLNLPIVVWMLYTYFKEIPGEILEAARMDGASLWREIVYVLTPMAVPGIASTLLLNTILAWNEAFWTINLTTYDAAPLTQFIAGYSSREGLFWATLSAASTLAILPIVVLGWFSQKQLVRGLTFGAVK
jgi:sorbitol/mannitol transport system permease protein